MEIKNAKKAYIVFLIISILMSLCSCKDERVYTDRIENYNAEGFSLDSPIFAKELPDNAEVVSFSYFDYWHEFHEYYLELKFQSEEELIEYIDFIKTFAIEYSVSNGGTYRPENEEWFIESKNPYSSEYIDLFLTTYQTSKADKRFTGYKIEYSSEEGYAHYFNNFGVISYSLNDLTVIQASSQGGHNDDDYIPKYFTRFCVPITENHERYFYFN